MSLWNAASMTNHTLSAVQVGHWRHATTVCECSVIKPRLRGWSNQSDGPILGRPSLWSSRLALNTSLEPHGGPPCLEGLHRFTPRPATQLSDATKSVHQRTVTITTERWQGFRGDPESAEEGNRTLTPLRAQRPERCVSTSSTTSARATMVPRHCV